MTLLNEVYFKLNEGKGEVMVNMFPSTLKFKFTLEHHMAVTLCTKVV